MYRYIYIYMKTDLPGLRRAAPGTALGDGGGPGGAVWYCMLSMQYHDILCMIYTLSKVT